jgi:hypothetical protein
MAFGFRHFEGATCQLWGGFTGCLSLLEPRIYDADSAYSRHLGWLRHFSNAVRKIRQVPVETDLVSRSRSENHDCWFEEGVQDFFGPGTGKPPLGARHHALWCAFRSAAFGQVGIIGSIHDSSEAYEGTLQVVPSLRRTKAAVATALIEAARVES